MSMREAIARFVPDGASVCMGTGLEALIPFAAGHEMIRQGASSMTTTLGRSSGRAAAISP